MVFTSKTAGLALLSLGLAARQAMAVDTCADLISEVGLVSGTGAIEITADLECPSHFEIASSQDVTITGGGFTITIGAGFAGSTLEDSGGGSLIVNEGTLTLEGITFKTLDTNGNRAVWNKGELHVLECTFELGHDGAYLDDGGVIYSNSARSIDITSSTFKSSVALLRGGALCADGSETLTIIDSEFTGSEVGIGLADGEESSGGHLWLSRDVELQVEGSVFTNSGAAGSGGAIVCCGGSISTSNITSADSSSESEHFGAMLVGGRGEEECPRVLSLVDVVFIGNSALPTTGAGGALAIFDTSATITDCEFWGSSGTAVLFESTSTTGDHQLTLSTTQFNQNNNPSEAYYAGTQEQGSAIVITNTGVSDGESVDMGTFTNTYCFGNEPYECEMVYHGANIVEDGEFKCHICNEDGERQVSDTDEGFEDASSRSVDDGSSGNQGIVIGLSLALGLTLVVIGALAVWKFRVRKNARRLMEDMGESDL